MEIWKDIAGYEGLYQVSNLGRVKSLKKGRWGTGKERILKPAKDGNGYLFVKLCKDGNSKMYHIHRLVADAFIPNPDNLPTVDHINRDRTDNRVENLRWASMKMQAENKCEWDRTNQKIAVAKSCKERCSIPVSQYTKSGEFVAIYPSTREAERQTGINKGNINSCIKGRYKSDGGYIWRYL